MIAKEDEACDDDSEYNIYSVVEAIERDEEHRGSALHLPIMKR